MATRKKAYAAAASFVPTLTSLASDGWRALAAQDNTTNGYVDCFVGGSIQLGVVAANGTVELFAYGSWDGGSHYTAGLTGAEATITWGTTQNTRKGSYNDLLPLGPANALSTDAANVDFVFGPFSIASIFGGNVPDHWGIVVHNNTGIAFHATGTN